MHPDIGQQCFYLSIGFALAFTRCFHISGLVEVLQLYFQNKCLATYTSILSENQFIIITEFVFSLVFVSVTKLSLLAESMLSCVCVDEALLFLICMSIIISRTCFAR